MDRYTKDGNVLPQNRIMLRIGEGENFRQVINPSHELLVENGWTLYTEPTPTAEEQLAIAKRMKRREAMAYDASEAVNMFYIGDLPVWLDKATRTGLMLRFQAEMATGKTDTELWHKGVAFPLPLTTAMQMLYAIELYASACYDNTQAHLAGIDNCSTAEELLNYDFTAGYPDKLRF